MSEYTIVGDPHIKPGNLETTAQLFDLVEGMGRPVIWLGDMLDTKEVVRSRCLNVLYRYLKGSDLQHTILVGNHDWHNLECKDHALEPLKELENATIVDKPLIINEMLLLPYIHSPKEFKETVAKYARRVVSTVLIMHQGVNGFDFGNGFIEENGVDMGDLPKFGTIISGHFHKYQKKGNLTYVGTPFSHSFGESNQDKYIMLFNTEGHKQELIETPFPKHITLEMDAIWMTPDKIKEGNHYRVVLTGPVGDIEAFDKSKFPGVKFIERPEEEATSTALISETASNEEKFVTWAKEVRKLDKETIELGLEIMGD